MRTLQAPNRHMRPFHSAKSVYAEHSIDHALQPASLTADDARLIRDFIAEMKATQGIGVSRANKLTFILVSWRRFIGPFRTNTVADLYRGIEALREARHDNIPYKQNTLKDHLTLLKRFSRWLREMGYSNVPADKIEGIRAPKADRMTNDGQMLTEDEVRAIIDACQTSRDRAIIATLYEGGFRVQELGTLTWAQVKFNDYGTVVNVDEKTGAPQIHPARDGDPVSHPVEERFPVPSHTRMPWSLSPTGTSRSRMPPSPRSSRNHPQGGYPEKNHSALVQTL